MQNCVYSILNSSLNLVACNCAPHFVSVIITHFVSLSHVTVFVLASLQVKQLCHFTCTTVATLRHVCCLLKNIRSCFECCIFCFWQRSCACSLRHFFLLPASSCAIVYGGSTKSTPMELQEKKCSVLGDKCTKEKKKNACSLVEQMHALTLFQFHHCKST